MFQALKKAFLPLTLIALIVAAGSLLQSQPVRADLAGTGADDGVWFLENYAPGAVDNCVDGTLRDDVRLFGTGDVSHINEESGIETDEGLQDPIVQIGAEDELILCVDGLEQFNVVFRTSGAGIWNEAHCGTLGDECEDEEGVGSGTLTVIAAGNDTEMIAITFSCEAAGPQDISIIQDDANAGDGDDIFFTIMCKGEPANLSATISPASVESAPALGNSSVALIQAIFTDASGGPVLPGTIVEMTASRCLLSTGAVDNEDTHIYALAEDLSERDYAVLLFEAFADDPANTFDEVDDLGALYAPTGNVVEAIAIEVDTNDPPDGVPNHSEALALFHGEGCEPGPVTITIRIENELDDLEITLTINVIGPPAFITVTAAPTQLICGEKSEITVSVTDKLNQLVSDHTFIEVITNWGGVLGGTGSSLTVGGPVDPISNTTVTLLKGVGKAYLLTSDTHVGPYEVLAASTGSYFLRNRENHAPVTAQVTVTCTKGTPAVVTAPNTGTGTNAGTIRPPNTGDAGLAAGSDSATLFVIAGAAAFVLAGLTSLRFARNRG